MSADKTLALLKSTHLKLNGKRFDGAKFPSNGQFVVQDGNLSLFVNTGVEGDKSLRVPFAAIPFYNFIEVVRSVINDEIPFVQMSLSNGKPREPVHACNIMIAKNDVSGLVSLTFMTPLWERPLSFGIFLSPYVSYCNQDGSKLDDKLAFKYGATAYFKLVSDLGKLLINTTYVPYNPNNSQGGNKSYGGGNNGGNKSYGGGNNGGGAPSGGAALGYDL